MLAGIWSSADRDSESHIPRAFYGQRHTCFYLFHFLQHGKKKSIIVLRSTHILYHLKV